MSHVSHIHTVTPFVAGKSEALSGQRLAKVGYKTTKKAKARFVNICVSVPRIGTEEVDAVGERIWNHIQEWLEGKQDDVIRSLYEGKNGKMETIEDADISMEAIIAYMDAEAAGGRMNKEMIERWFADHLEENLVVRIAELRSIEDETVIEKEVMPIVRGYRGMFSALATGVTVYPEDKCKNLLRALELADEDSPIEKSLKNRLTVMMAPKPEKIAMVVENL